MIGRGQLENNASIFPVIFVGVAVFLLNVVISRMVAIDGGVEMPRNSEVEVLSADAVRIKPDMQVVLELGAEANRYKVW